MASETFGRRLAYRRSITIIPATPEREEHTMTQAELAEVIGVSLSGLRHYERDRRLPHTIVRRAILRLWPDFFEPVSVTLQ